VGVDDIRAETARGTDRAEGQARVPQLPAAAPIENDALDLVPACGQRPLETLYEDAEVGRGGRRIHLRDEEDAHRRII
jgi:hypothetical protein